MSARRAFLPVATIAASLVLFAAGARAQTGVLDLLGAAGAGRGAAGVPTGTLELLPMAGPVDAAEYVVGPGDLLSVHLTGGVTRNWDAMLSPEGTLFVPTVGDIPLTGLTLLDARRLVIQRVSAVYRGVAIDMRLVRPRIMLVNLAGETRHPGPLQVVATSHATEVLADTLFARRASTRNVEVRRRTPQGEVRIRVDVQRFRLTGQPARDPLLRDGDVLFVPVATTSIGIEGAMGRPGFYELAPGDSLSTLLALAGGPVVESADQATLVRFRDATHTDTLGFRISDVLAGRFDVPLRDGDRALVYFQPRYHQLERVTILGEVQAPGPYALSTSDTRLSDILSASGGFLPNADLTTLRIYRANRAGEADPDVDRLAARSRKEMTASEYEVLRAHLSARREDFRVDWTRVRGNPDLDLTLRDGDIVRVDPVLPAVRVEGEVRRPGVVRFEAGRKVEVYVRLAGGFSDRAARGQVRITRAVTGQTVLARDASGIEPGDLVWVPDRGESTAWQNIHTTLLVLAQIATVLVAVRPR